MNRYLAIDIGASSGRHIVGWKEGGELRTEEVFRFPNGVLEKDGRLTWDLDALLGYVKEGISKARAAFPDLVSLSVDTWGVDYVLMRGSQEVLPCYAYRDSRTEEIIPRVHEIVPFDLLYRRTGIQFQPFNTVYQLMADLEAGRLEGATDFLMLPCWLMYKLCGVKAHEYTNATTGGLVSAETGEYDAGLIRALGLPAHLFPALRQPGEIIGEYEGLKVVLCPTHDTASAVEGTIAQVSFPCRTQRVGSSVSPTPPAKTAAAKALYNSMQVFSARSISAAPCSFFPRESFFIPPNPDTAKLR